MRWKMSDKLPACRGVRKASAAGNNDNLADGPTFFKFDMGFYFVSLPLDCGAIRRIARPESTRFEAAQTVSLRHDARGGNYDQEILIPVRSLFVALHHCIVSGAGTTHQDA